MRWYHYLVIFPILALTVGIYYANSVEPFIMGLPFLMFWIVAWVVITALVMLLINILDNKRSKETP
ncbi:MULTISPECIES: DUF3311 domain-containing protein [Providencia]|uniref:Putative membrane protein n=1 Tax=Providencia heimbachae ATCC 35613 TaxID=1354272 RepID=A0A1B7JJV2_9GAMM|nr:DUF3311 domain-containing protein [Providencia heimbachae]MBP6124036.1 DUF3311 domain-containing protein [Providencia sp.]MDD9339753.1 DUF3311 domain-containing protein [Providencia heimbachae]NIH22333.1 DUF3311 domain-containing protein [Providencia heimbachae]OAT48188.1 putative membrane protein [Providencia heimbachae ATCC 35613]QCJ69718.1 DUF3311 domain-containing protein [Providencia heimbachae]